MFEIDRRGSAIVFTRRMDGRRIAKATLVFRHGARIEMPGAGSPAAELAMQIVDRVSADQSLGKIKRLDQEEPMVVGRGKCLVRLAIHGARGRYVQNGYAYHCVGMIET